MSEIENEYTTYTLVYPPKHYCLCDDKTKCNLVGKYGHFAVHTTIHATIPAATNTITQYLDFHYHLIKITKNL